MILKGHAFSGTICQRVSQNYLQFRNFARAHLLIGSSTVMKRESVKKIVHKIIANDLEMAIFAKLCRGPYGSVNFNEKSHRQ